MLGHTALPKDLTPQEWVHWILCGSPKAEEVPYPLRHIAARIDLAIKNSQAPIRSQRDALTKALERLLLETKNGTATCNINIVLEARKALEQAKE